MLQDKKLPVAFIGNLPKPGFCRAGFPAMGTPALSPARSITAFSNQAACTGEKAFVYVCLLVFVGSSNMFGCIYIVPEMHYFALLIEIPEMDLFICDMATGGQHIQIKSDLGSCLVVVGQDGNYIEAVKAEVTPDQA